MKPNILELPARLTEEAAYPIAEARNERVRRGIEYWDCLRGARPMPAREEITLRGMVRFVSDCLIVQVINGGADYTFGFMGDGMVRAFNVSLTGKRLSDIDAVLPVFGGQLRALYERALGGEAFLTRGHFQSQQRSLSHSHETAILPLGRGGVVEHFLIVGVQIPFRFWEAGGDEKIRALARAG